MYGPIREKNGNGVHDISEFDRRVMIEYMHISLYELYSYQRSNRLYMNPQFSHFPKWDLRKKSRVIESALLNIPLPPIYLAEMRSGPMIVLDGHHRLSCFFDFLEDHFRLSGMSLMSHLNEFRFNRLEASIRRKLQDYSISVHVIKSETHPAMRHEIVKRIHEGSQRMKPEQFRVLLIEAEFQRLLAENSNNREFNRAIKGKIPKSYEQEVILRFLAFADGGYYHYNGNLTQFINKYLDDSTRILSSNRIFQETMEAMCLLYGDEEEFHPSLKGKVEANISFFEWLAVVLTRHQFPLHNNNLHELRRRVDRILDNDELFVSSLLKDPTSKKNVFYRYEAWSNKI